VLKFVVSFSYDRFTRLIYRHANQCGTGMQVTQQRNS